MTERAIVFNCVVGSHLYGTNVETSDEDFGGVFAPSLRDCVKMDNPDSEWSFGVKKSLGPRNEVGDVDHKLFSIKRFIKLAGDGQPGQLEYFFVPKDKVLKTTPIWDYIRDNREMFFSRSNITPFVGFARQQIRKATMKGESYNVLQYLYNELCPLKDKPEGAQPLSSLFEDLKEDIPVGKGSAKLANSTFPVYENEYGYQMILIANTQFDTKVPIKVFVKRVKKLIDTYGTRSFAASKLGYDPKSLLHALRWVGQAEEFFSTKHITFPRPESARLRRLRDEENPMGASELKDFLQELEERANGLAPLAERSSLPDKPDWGKLESLCEEIHIGIFKRFFSFR